ncbi:hypothetical protein QTP86_016348 [Hemibagrus guttatus]|nr:hypothetical protein QTP86_016348 [Hemibagrus guttatus]
MATTSNPSPTAPFLFRNTVVDWSPSCLSTCLRSAALDSVLPTTKEEFPDLSKVPPEFSDLRSVFSKSRAVSLPPDCPYDCAIDILPGTNPPRGYLYSSSGPETEAMQRYISELLAAGIIQPSSSPAGAGFSLSKRRTSLCVPVLIIAASTTSLSRTATCYPSSSAFKLLQGACIFTKLDLRNAYHLVRIKEGDDWKMAFNTPSGHYEYVVVPFGLGPMHLWSFRPSSMMFSGTSSTSLSLRTSATF